MDGQEDRVVSSPMSCNINFNDHLCVEGESTGACFTQAEAELFNTLYQGVKTIEGEIVYASILFGSENYTDFWLFGTQEEPAWGVLASLGYRDLLTQDLLGKPVEQHVSTEQMLKWNNASTLPARLNAMDIDLSALQKNDTKLFI
jgi:hypothetical protein